MLTHFLPWWRFGRSLRQCTHVVYFTKSPHDHLHKDKHDAHGEKQRRKDELLDLRLALSSSRMEDLVPRQGDSVGCMLERHPTECLAWQISEVFATFSRKQTSELRMDGSAFRKVTPRPPHDPCAHLSDHKGGLMCSR